MGRTPYTRSAFEPNHEIEVLDRRYVLALNINSQTPAHVAASAAAFDPSEQFLVLIGQASAFGDLGAINGLDVFVEKGYEKDFMANYTRRLKAYHASDF